MGWKVELTRSVNFRRNLNRFMNSNASQFFARKNVDSLIAGAFGFFIIFMFTRHSGIGISPDSVSYLSTERNLSSGHGLIQFNQLPLVDFPAFYPFFLSVIHLITGMDPLRFAPVLNASLFAILLYISGSMMNGFSTPSKIYKRILLSCFLLSPCLLEVYPMLWSETLFLIESLFFILALTRYLQNRSMRDLLMAAIIASLACITRYAGVTLIGTGALLIIFDLAIKAGKRWSHLLIFSAVSVSLLAINLIRNRLVTGFSTGVRQKGVTPLMDNISYFGSVLCEWLPLPKNDPHLSMGIGVLLIIFLIVLVVLFIRNQSYAFSYEKVATSFALVYSLFILVSATVSRYQQLNSRLLSPFFIPFLWSISFWLPPLIQRSRSWQRVLIIACSILFAAGLQYNQWLADYETYDGVKDAGVPGYTEDPVPQYQLVQYIQQHTDSLKKGYPIYSNAADAVYFFTGKPAQLLPQNVFPDQVNKFYSEGHHYLIWFNDPEIDNPDEVHLPAILLHKKMNLIAQFPEGAIYEAD